MVSAPVRIDLINPSRSLPINLRDRIETQDILFSRQDAISRFVELGPAKVLAGMAKRTRDSKFAAMDLSRSLERQFLASTQDVRELRYEYNSAAPQAEAQTSEKGTSQPADAVVAPAAVKVATMAAAISPQAAAVAAASIADVPTSAQEIVRALVAHKLRKEIEQVLPSRSIKELSGGEWATVAGHFDFEVFRLTLYQANPHYRTSLSEILVMSLACYLMQPRICP